LKGFARPVALLPGVCPRAGAFTGCDAEPLLFFAPSGADVGFFNEDAVFYPLPDHLAALRFGFVAGDIPNDAPRGAHFRRGCSGVAFAVSHASVELVED